ncbi:VOC family protein [Phenylobacterium aquaticum]|uniref:VOC family protein n=1 Tax=Phenylobacterium aquaticum TaxID=1763816 RepID=UPI001F5DC552|nr:VOC family protein [Phenylobacterium aquaticum]MCI3132925.1 VOC family protein [Phenylobacterium aquaticum]
MKIQPFLMFQNGQCQAALDLYVSLIPGAQVLEIAHFPEGQGAPAIMRAVLSLGGQTVICNDSPVKHAFDFTPSFSLFVDCETEAEVDRLAAALGEGGSVLMPVGDYGFSRRFAWVSDRFGVSWQINLP